MSGQSITIAVLAGGAASRLGGIDKGLVQLQGRPLIDWVIGAIAAARWPPALAIDVLISANRNQIDYARYGRTISDTGPGFAGPLAGISTALASGTTAWVLTLPVDCPTPPDDLLYQLADNRHRSAAVTVHDGQRRQPLFALYRRDLAPSAAAAVQAGKGVQAWQDSIGVTELDFSDHLLQFHNLNSLDDFANHGRRRPT